jgi:hypothetical protein
VVRRGDREAFGVDGRLGLKNAVNIMLESRVIQTSTHRGLSIALPHGCQYLGALPGSIPPRGLVVVVAEHAKAAAGTTAAGKAVGMARARTRAVSGPI